MSSIELNDRKTLVVGLGASGLAAAELCMAQGARLTLNDSRDGGALEGALGALATDDVERVLGGHPTQVFEEAELIVLSPGVPPLPALAAARAAGVPIIGELELGARFVEAPIVAITGTNGKSTTTSLCGAMLAEGGRPTFVGGNLGVPLCRAVLDDHPGLKPGGACVLELSSFQLETVARFHATVAMLLNLSEDHLDRYPDFDSYVEAKARVFERQTMDDWAVVNADPDQRRCQMIGSRSVAPLVTFRSERSHSTGAWTDADELCVRLPRGQVERYPRAALRLPGRHNGQNALAALLAARLSGASPASCLAALEGFEGLPHRMQLCGERDEVRFYNDSKATNVGSVVGSLSGFSTRVVLIAGGKDKGGDYAPLRPMLEQVCRHLVLIGAAADAMESALEGAAPISRAASMAEAVRRAAELAEPGDAVVLSPACSSYDMYVDYIARGDDFAAAVAALP
ncbi:MAG: UDP-N-acetylmuramoyl-L-alanine--D-glutamate ligase [Proteobacteria bacterium]|nr:MAG: UDP-N-acetylmuramoyl-L-alanine--D-glutamate ligase [Pseudomonadota bacterium]PIE17895.1 MAG: UDP-N-acetylmuramoyl-L-alanine--D-glutamate ligase [Pseudomonadota bacterium]